MNAVCLPVEIVTPAEFERRYGVALDCDGMQCENVITVKNLSDYVTICHEYAHYLFPYIRDHSLIEWLGKELAQ